MIILDESVTLGDEWGNLTLAAIERVSRNCADQLKTDPAGEELAADLQERVTAILHDKTQPEDNLVSYLMALTQAAASLKTYSKSHDPSDLEFSRAILARAN